MVENMFNKELSDVSFDIEALDEWKEIAKELGMDKQLELTKGDKSPIPYPYMNEVMLRVYNSLCPNHTEFKLYKNTAIPLEVMKQISFSVKEGHFQKIEIWADDKAPDPLVVGITCKFYTYAKEGGRTEDFLSKEELEKNYPGDSIYETDIKKYLIARWGDELRDFNELKSLSYERLLDDIGGELQKEIKTKSERLKLIKENVKSYLNGNMSLYEVKGN